MTGMHVREPRPCTSPLRGEHSGYKGPTNKLFLKDDLISEEDHA